MYLCLPLELLHLIEICLYGVLLLVFLYVLWDVTH